MELTDTNFMTAKEKAQVLRQWERFLKGGCQAKDFTEALYHHLMQHCMFIAHYDRGGFYATYFQVQGMTLSIFSLSSMPIILKL